MKSYVYSLFEHLSNKMQEEDKVKHIVWSFWLTLAALLLWTAPQAFIAVFLLGLAKEFWDLRYGSGFCLFDMAGNLLGSLAGLLCGFMLSTLSIWAKSLLAKDIDALAHLTEICNQCNFQVCILTI